MPVQLRSPYLLFLGEVDSATFVKTAAGIAHWRPERVAGQFRFPGNTLDLGLTDMTIAQAAEAGVGSLVIGVAPVGGLIGASWAPVLVEAAAVGIDIVNGLHHRLEDVPGLPEAANASGAALINVRIPPHNLPVGNGRKRSGRRLLTVGTDCAVGKKYTALAVTESLRNFGQVATFRATGQTGIMISGSGIPIDSVPADFISGAAELISPDNEAEHWDVIEGQGSLFNASYAGVSLGLLHGSQPDAIVVCHEAGKTMIDSCDDLPLPSIEACIALNLQCGRLTNPAVRCVGVSVNTSGLAAEEREPYLRKLAEETGLPCVDPVLQGCDAIARALLNGEREGKAQCAG